MYVIILRNYSTFKYRIHVSTLIYFILLQCKISVSVIGRKSRVTEIIAFFYVQN